MEYNGIIGSGGIVVDRACIDTQDFSSDSGVL